MAITKESGPRFCIGCVSTDIPLLPDKPVSLGGSEFCEKLHACYEGCPVGAIPNRKTLVRGLDKYYMDGAKRRRAYNIANECAICAIGVCVFGELAHRRKWLGNGEIKAQ